MRKPKIFSSSSWTFMFPPPCLLNGWETHCRLTVFRSAVYSTIHQFAPLRQIVHLCTLGVYIKSLIIVLFNQNCMSNCRISVLPNNHSTHILIASAEYLAKFPAEYSAFCTFWAAPHFGQDISCRSIFNIPLIPF